MFKGTSQEWGLLQNPSVGKTGETKTVAPCARTWRHLKRKKKNLRRPEPHKPFGSFNRDSCQDFGAARNTHGRIDCSHKLSNQSHEVAISPEYGSLDIWHLHGQALVPTDEFVMTCIHSPFLQLHIHPTSAVSVKAKPAASCKTVQLQHCFAQAVRQKSLEPPIFWMAGTSPQGSIHLKK